MFPIKATVVFRDKVQISEWKARFKVPIHIMVKHQGIPNETMVIKVLEKESDFKTRMYHLPQHKVQGSCTFSVENITQLQILELYMSIYNSELRKLYLSNRRRYMGKIDFEPQSVLTGITHTRRVISLLANAHSSSLSQARYSVQVFTPFIKFSVSYTNRAIVPKVVRDLAENGSIELQCIAPKDTITIQLFSGDRPLTAEDANYDKELASWTFNKDTLITHAAVDGQTFTFKCDHLHDALGYTTASFFNANLTEEKVMNLLMRRPLNSYNHGEISFEALNNFLVMCSDESDFTVTTIVAPTRKAKIEVMTMPFEDSSVIVVYEDRKHGLKVFYLITVPYNMVPEQVTEMLEVCLPQLFNAKLHCNSVYDCQVLQLRLAKYVTKSLVPAVQPFFESILRHLHSILGSDSVWGSPPEYNLTSGKLGGRILVKGNYGPGYFSVNYEVLDLNKDQVQTFEQMACSPIPELFVQYLRPELKPLFTKGFTESTKLHITKVSKP